MCGIVCDFGARPSSPDLAIELSARQASRGPDGSGLMSSQCGRVHLAHRRLAILGLGGQGAQPRSLARSPGRGADLSITYNGEIYNFREMRRSLAALGHVFESDSDTEVLLHAYAEYGVGFASELRGMYSLVIWDSAAERIVIARDPYGIKPLYMCRVNDRIVVASSAKAIATATGETSKSEVAAGCFYLTGSVPEPLTIFSSIEAFRPGLTLVVGLDGTIVDSRQIDAAGVIARQEGDPPSPGELRTALYASVESHFVSDVPVGIFLSGGVDSSMLLHLSARLGVPVETMTLSFSEFLGTSRDEASRAERFAHSQHADHVVEEVSRSEFEHSVEDFLTDMDQPTLDGLNTWLISRAAARRGWKVALSGLGGDELFGGYRSFSLVPKILNARRLLGPCGPVVSRGIGLLGRVTERVPPKLALALAGEASIQEAWLLVRSAVEDGHPGGMLDPELATECLHFLRCAASDCLGSSTSTHGAISALESAMYMRNQLLRDADWASMAHGLELRVPFVDYTLARALCSSNAPARLGKDGLSRPSVGLLPVGWVQPEVKTGFGLPMREWLVASDTEAASGAHHGKNSGWAQDWMGVVGGYFGIDDVVV